MNLFREDLRMKATAPNIRRSNARKAVPLLALLMPVEQAAPVAVLVSITIALLLLVKDWRKVHFSSAGWLTAFTLLGIPAGLLLLKTVPETIVKAILAVVIMAFSVHPFLSRRRYVLEDDRHAWLFGFNAGVLGGAYGMNGPPLAIYGVTPRRLRLTFPRVKGAPVSAFRRAS